MGVMIHGRTAGIHLHQIRIVGNKQFLLMGQRIIKIHRNSSNVIFTKKKAPYTAIGIRGGEKPRFHSHLSL
jgi:hypothetical protein